MVLSEGRPVLDRDNALFLMMCLIWGVIWIALKFGIAEMPPPFFAATRFTVAGFVPSAILAEHGKIARPARPTSRLFARSLLMITGSCALLFWGMRYVSSGLGGVIETSLTRSRSWASRSSCATSSSASPALSMGLLLC